MKKKRKIIILIILISAIYLAYKNNDFSDISYNFNKFVSKITNISEYKTIKQDTNNNYSGKGQEKVKNRDGYFTTFTTIENHQKTYIEYKQNGNSSWSSKQYWGGTMAENGCGITAIATILSGYTQKYTPEDLRQKYYPVLNYDALSEKLSNTFNIKNTDFYYDNVHLSKEKLQEHLKTNRPILICVWNQPNDNRWTTASHYMVLLATDDKDMVYISNPNGGENDSKSSGWYKFKEVTPYIAKALYVESYE
ncbi:MAG: C39 family peptidase [Bacilli bacterium]